MFGFSTICHLAEAELEESDWTGVKSIGTCKVVKPGEKPYERIFILSTRSAADELEVILRGHWGVEIPHCIMNETMNWVKHQACTDIASIICTIHRRSGMQLLRMNRNRDSLKE